MSTLLILFVVPLHLLSLTLSSYLHNECESRGDDEWVPKHVPVLTFALSDDGLTATILVGDDELGIYHPKVASDDPNKVHFITHVMAMDEVSVHVLYVYLLCVSLAFCNTMTYSFLYYL